MKDFIRKCLEIDEKKRMSLDDLKDWLEANGCERNNSTKSDPLKLKKEENMPKLNLSHKPNSQIEKLRSEYTQRPSYNSHADKDKENIKNRLSESENIPKSIV